MTGGLRSSSVTATTVWAEASGIPDVLADLIDDASALAPVIEVLKPARRVVATGNGAALYAASAMAQRAWRDSRYDVVAVPAGILSSGDWSWRPGDVPVVFSSSGELRDVVALRPDQMPDPWVLSTSTPGSTLHRRAAASAVVPLRSQDAVTHTQAYAGNVLVGIMLAGALAGRDPRDGLSGLPHDVAQALAAAPAWAGEALGQLPAAPSAAVAFGTGGASVAALETALLLKEMAGIPAEGLETREGATSGMYALRRGHLVVAHPTADDPLVEEAMDVCRRTGAHVLATPGGTSAARELAPLTTFPAAIALAGALGLRAGLDIDHPAWTSAYYETARINTEASDE